jgi:CRP-like cAMP-binding protein
MHPSRTHPAAPHTTNALLRCLPEEDLTRLWPRFERVALKSRRVLHYPDAPMEHAYFIEQGLVSVLAHTGPGKSVEVWLIGREGFVGLPIILGQNISVHRRIVQVSGSALRIRADHLREAMDQAATLRDLLLLSIQTVLIQTSQLAGCNAHHGVEQRLARWLLMAQDRCQTEALALTHDMLSRLLGVRRATVSECIGALEEQKILGRARSLIRITARPRLETVACSCYRVIRSVDDRFRQTCEDSRAGSRTRPRASLASPLPPALTGLSSKPSRS